VRSLTIIAAPRSCGLDSISTPHFSDSQVAASEPLSTALVDSVSLYPSPLAWRRLGSSDSLEQR